MRGPELTPPAFWTQPDNPLGALLAPLGWLYAAAAAGHRRLATPSAAGVPVICVGNLCVGGAGKTPVAAWIARHLKQRGVDVHVLSRGYGGRQAGPLRVEPDRHTAAEVGDEPLLLAREAPTWIARERVKGAREAVAAGAQALVLDDGFQNPWLDKTLSLVVVDGDTGFGNGRVLPAGPLREPLAAGLGRADAVVVMGADRAGIADAVRGVRPGLPLLAARLEPEPEAAALAGRRVVAFAGIGRPGKLWRTLTDLGCHLVARHAFPDHHPYTDAEVRALLDEAAGADATPVTTAKDAVRLPRRLRERVTVVPVAVAWEAAAMIETLLDRALGDGG